jgi:hypothetical protein
MKKLFLMALVLTMGTTFAFTSCGGGDKFGGQVQGESFTTERWVDDNTFQLAASGVANSKLKDKTARRESAKRAAILNAQYQVLEKFKGSKIEGAAGMSDFENTGIAIAQEIQGVVKGGSVKKSTFDPDTDACEIIYEVKAKGLKKKVQAADWE